MVDNAVYGFFFIGVSICICLNGLFKTNMEESIEAIKLRLWKLKGKTKQYVKENAEEVLKHVKKNEDAVGDGKKVKKGQEKQKSKEHRIRDLKYGLEEPWCCEMSMSPV